MIYELECRKCGYFFEVKASLAEKEEFSGEKFKCPECNSQEVELVITGANINCGSGDNDACCGGGCCGCGH